MHHAVDTNSCISMQTCACVCAMCSEVIKTVHFFIYQTQLHTQLLSFVIFAPNITNFLVMEFSVAFIYFFIDIFIHDSELFDNKYS